MKFAKRQDKHNDTLFHALGVVGNHIIGTCDCGHGDFEHESDHSQSPPLFGKCRNCVCPAFVLQHKIGYIDYMKILHPWIEKELKDYEIRNKNIDWTKDPRNEQPNLREVKE